MFLHDNDTDYERVMAPTLIIFENSQAKSNNSVFTRLTCLYFKYSSTLGAIQILD